jgi:kynureninase
VFRFFETQRLTPTLLREVSQHQVGVLATEFDALGLDPQIVDRDRSVPLTEIAGFLALKCPRAGEVTRALKERGVATDARGDALRLGPAPYLSDRQLRDAIGLLGEVVRLT